MADPLSIIGGVASILQISSMVIKLIKAAKGASHDRQHLLMEINATAALCQTLRDYAEMNAESWVQTLQTLSQSGVSPLEQFKRSLEEMYEKLTSNCKTDRRLRALVQNFKWPFTKTEVLELVATIERQKSIINLALTNDNLRLSSAIRDETLRITEKVDALQLSQEAQGHETHVVARSINSLRLQQEIEVLKSQSKKILDKKQKLLAQMTSIDFEATHADISSSRAKNTGQWLLASPEYISWRKKSSSIMWCGGMPGAGKTILASLVIDSLRGSGLDEPLRTNQMHSAVAGIYCSYKSPQTTKNLLGSILQQLLQPLSDVSDTYQIASIEDLSRSLIKVFKEHQSTFIIVDALDECPNRAEFLREMQTMCELTRSAMGNTSLHILVTGRYNVAAEMESGLTPDERLEIRSNEADVRNYLHQNLCLQGQLSEWIIASPEFGELIMSTIISRVTGMFLLARLYVDLLADIPTKRGVRKALDRLPASVDDTYADAWNRISAQSPHKSELGKKILRWVIHATRPLRVSELREALAIEEGDEIVDPEGLLDAAHLTSFCAGLLIINEKRQVLSLIHPTTQEYFNAQKEILFPTAHEYIAAECITYLRLKPFRDQGPLQEYQAFRSRADSYALLGYTAVNWGYHAQRARNKHVIDLTLDLLKDESARAAAIQALSLNTIGALEWGTEWPEAVNEDLHTLYIEHIVHSAAVSLAALHVAAYFGLIDAAEIVLQEGATVNDLDGFVGTPIRWALLNGQDEMLQYLLNQGADPNIRMNQVELRRWPLLGTFTRPLTLAAFMGNTVAIELLIEHGADIDNEEDEQNHSTALSVALYGKQIEATRLLLAKGANVNEKNLVGTGDAARYENPQLLQMIVDSGANAEHVQCALESAASACRWIQIMFLLQHGADPNGCILDRRDCEFSTSQTPLYELIFQPDSSVGHQYMATPLVSVNTSEWSDQRADQLKCLKALLDAGADVNGLSLRTYFYAGDFVTLDCGGWTVPKGRYTTPLCTAAYFRRLDNIVELVRRGADVNFVFAEFTSALSSALDGESYEEFWDDEIAPGDCPSKVKTTVELLIGLGADPTLCTPKAQQRIQELLHISPQECDQMVALQEVVQQPQLGLDEHNTKSFRERRAELRKLIDAGAEPRLCCERDRRRIQEFLGWTEQEINILDRHWENVRVMRTRSAEGPL